MCDALCQLRGRLKAVVLVRTLKLIQSKEYQPPLYSCMPIVKGGVRT